VEQRAGHRLHLDCIHTYILARAPALRAGRTVAKRVGTVHTGSKTVHVFGVVPMGVLFIGIRYCILTGGTVHRDPSL
jgi:hypothetical protein